MSDNPPTSSNSIDKVKLKRFVTEIERCDAEKIVEHSAYMNKCGAIAERRGDWIEQAKVAGIPKVELKAILKDRVLTAKKTKLYEDLDSDQQAVFGQMDLALGDGVEQPARKPHTPVGMPGADAAASTH